MVLLTGMIGGKLFIETIPEKINCKVGKGTKNSDISSCFSFSCYDQGLIFGREDGYSLPPTNFGIFLRFLSFKILNQTSFGNTLGNSCTNFDLLETRSTLLVANQAYTNMWHCFIMLFTRLNIPSRILDMSQDLSPVYLRREGCRVLGLYSVLYT